MAEPYLTRIRIDREVQLLVEGRDEVNFFSALVDFHNIDPVQIQNLEGKDKLRKFLAALRRAPGFETVRSLGVVRDADESPASAFQSVRDSLRNAGLPAPNRAGERSGEAPAVTVFILPGDNRPGMLETLLRESFAGGPEDRCVEEYLACVGGLPGRVHRQAGQGPHSRLAGVAARSACVGRGGGAKGILGLRPSRIRGSSRFPVRLVGANRKFGTGPPPRRHPGRSRGGRPPRPVVYSQAEFPFGDGAATVRARQFAWRGERVSRRLDRVGSRRLTPARRRGRNE